MTKDMSSVLWFADSVAVKWETGVIVMFALLFFFGILSAIVTGLFKCKGKQASH